MSKWSFPLKLQIQQILGNVGNDFLSELLPRQRWSRKRGKAENDTFNSTPWLPCSSLASCQRIKQTKPRSPISSESTVLQLQWPIGSFLVCQTNTKIKSKNKSECFWAKWSILNFSPFFETFSLNSFVSVCLVASTTTRAEKLPEGLEEQVESTIIDPIARLREFPTQWHRKWTRFSEEVIPGSPGEDYPIYSSPPETSFSCDGFSRGACPRCDGRQECE